MDLIYQSRGIYMYTRISLSFQVALKALLLQYALFNGDGFESW